jgi:hypothetical protein
VSYRASIEAETPEVVQYTEFMMARVYTVAPIDYRREQGC